MMISLTYNYNQTILVAPSFDLIIISLTFLYHIKFWKWNWIYQKIWIRLIYLKKSDGVITSTKVSIGEKVILLPMYLENIYFSDIVTLRLS